MPPSMKTSPKCCKVHFAQSLNFPTDVKHGRRGWSSIDPQSFDPGVVCEGLVFLLIYDDYDFIQGLDPMSYNKLCLLIKILKTFQKGTLA